MLNKIKENPNVFLLATICTIVSLIDILENKGYLLIGTFNVSLVVAGIILLIVFLNSMISYILKRIRPLYADAQIKSFKVAHKSIYLSIHSLNSVSCNPKYKEFNETLKHIAEQGVEVKVIVPGGIERARGAYELCQLYNFDVRFIDQLEDEDLRFTLVDDDIVIISYQKIPSKRLSRKYAYIKSINLNSILKNYFVSLWESNKSMNFKDYILKLMNDLCYEEDESLPRISNRLQIPLDCLQQIINRK